MKQATKAAPWKKEEVKRLQQELQHFNIIGIADMTSMPSPQLQKLRSTLKDSVKISMTKTRLLTLAIDNLTGKIPGIEELKKHLHGMPALVLTNDNPFKLAKILNKNKSTAPAKPGQLAPYDIFVPAGPTPFSPGPVIGELGSLGIKATIQEGKVTIKEDTLAAKEGEEISAGLAAMLTKLSIEPMEIGINLLATLEKGTIYSKSILSIDETVYLNNLKLAARRSFNLTLAIAYPTKQAIKLLLNKAALNADSLANSRNILTSKTAGKQLTKAEREAKTLAHALQGYEAQEPQSFEAPEKKEEQPQKESPQQQETRQPNEQQRQENVSAQQLLEQAKSKENHDQSPEQADKKFKEEERVAQDVLKKLQDKKINKPRWAL